VLGLASLAGASNAERRRRIGLLAAKGYVFVARYTRAIAAVILPLLGGSNAAEFDVALPFGRKRQRLRLDGIDAGDTTDTRLVELHGLSLARGLVLQLRELDLTAFKPMAETFMVHAISYRALRSALQTVRLFATIEVRKNSITAPTVGFRDGGRLTPALSAP
jgi:hypothetical protein